MSRTDHRAPKRAIFIVITDYPGGAERIALNLASELSLRKGWTTEFFVICARAPNSFTASALRPGIRVRFGPFRSWFLSFPLTPLRLLFARYDLVFTTHIYTNALLSLMRRLGLVRIGRHVARESTSVFDRSTGARRRLFGLLYRLYSGEDLLIAQTHYMSQHVKPWLPALSAERVHVLPNPVSTGDIRKAASQPLEADLRARLDGRRNILFCARLTEIKRPQIALDAFQIVADRNPGSQLVFMGDGPLEPGLRASVTATEIRHRVLLLGFRTNPYAVMAACQYGLLTSRCEGFPNVLLEMMACGIAKVVTTPCAGGLDQLAGVAITESFDAESIAVTLNAALESGEDCGQIYRDVVQSRSVNAYLDQILDR